jgi:hypothetical protein
MAEVNGMGYRAVQEMVEFWDTSKCVPTGSSLANREALTSAKNISSQLLELCAVKGNNFLYIIVTGDETGFTTLIWKQNARA